MNLLIKLALRSCTYFQLLLVNTTYLISKYINISKADWIIGVDEIAKVINDLKVTLPNSCSVSFSVHPFYNLNYDYSLTLRNKYLLFIIRFFWGPILFGYLLHKSKRFIYIWHTGFLLDRSCEFSILKKKNAKIICLFVGDDIRHPDLMKKLSEDYNIDTIETYSNTRRFYTTDKIKMTAQNANSYSDLIFNYEMDQASFISGKQYAWPYMFNPNDFKKNEDKFSNVKRIKILHAPSSPIIKGTPLVRAAIKKLQLEGYQFDYIEIQNKSNDVVMQHLKLAHVVLNQFYAFVPGVFGIESMASRCAVLMSADPTMEKGLPAEFNNAWLITRYWEVYDNLKYLLDNPDKIKYYADNGYQFVNKHYTYEAAQSYLNKIFQENNII